MSTYNAYAVRLDQAFRAARRKFDRVLYGYIEAYKAKEAAYRWDPGISEEENIRRRRRSDGPLMERAEELQAAEETVWKEFDSQAALILCELEQAAAPEDRETVKAKWDALCSIAAQLSRFQRGGVRDWTNHLTPTWEAKAQALIAAF